MMRKSIEPTSVSVSNEVKKNLEYIAQIGGGVKNINNSVLADKLFDMSFKELIELYHELECRIKSIESKSMKKDYNLEAESELRYMYALLQKVESKIFEYGIEF